jgi:hypothetical protein
MAGLVPDIDVFVSTVPHDVDARHGSYHPAGSREPVAM